MGQVNVKNANITEEQIKKLQKYYVKLDPERELNSEMLQLKSWTLQEIRSLYENYLRRGDDEPLISLSVLSKLLPFSRTNSRVIFQSYSGGASIK